MVEFKFPKVESKCTSCGGSGEQDTSYHGSSWYDTCMTCKGDKSLIFKREMTVDEKLDYLLTKVMEKS